MGATEKKAGSSARARSGDSPRRAIIVAGMHRSGTSAAAHVVSMLGLNLPRSPMGPAPGNALGHWGESERIYELQKQLLAAAETSWDDVSPFPASWAESPVGEEWRSRMAQGARRRVSRHRTVRVQGSEDLPSGALLAVRPGRDRRRARLPHPGPKPARGSRVAEPPRRLSAGEGDPPLAAAQPRRRAGYPRPSQGVRLLRRTPGGLARCCGCRVREARLLMAAVRASRRDRDRARNEPRRAPSRVQLGATRREGGGSRVGEGRAPPPPRRVRGVGRPRPRRARRNLSKRRGGGSGVRTRSGCGRSPARRLSRH